MEQHRIIGRLSSGINVNAFSSYFFNAWLIIFALKTVRANVLTRENQASHSLVNLYKTANLYLVDTPPFPMGYRLIQVRLYFNLLSNCQSNP